MRLWAEIKKRRVFPFLGGYIAAGFLVLEAVDQLVGNGILPPVGYPIALIFYLFGIPGTTILAWFHGEKGTQKPPPIEIWLQAGMLVLALAISYRVVRSYDGESGPALAEGSLLDPRRVAVLYFSDLDDGDLGFVADGLSEALIDRLSQVRALDVVSRNGVAPFKGSDLMWDSIGRILNAGSLIAGSVEEQGDRLRVTTRLVDGVSGADIQRRVFELPASDLLMVRDSLSREVASFLRERLGEEIRLRERRAETSSPEAWSLLQRAERLRKDAEAALAEDRYEAVLGAFERADSILTLAEAADPSWVEPIVLRGLLAYRRARIAESDSEFERWTRVGLDHAERALSRLPNYPPAMELRGTLRYARWVLNRPPDPEDADSLLEAARTDLEEATRLDPTLAGAHATLSHLYYQVEDVPAAVLSAREAYEEDAYLDLADVILWRLFNGSLDLEQFAQARRWCDEGRRRFPLDYRFTLCELYLMATPAEQPEVDRAWTLLKRLEDLTPEHRLAYERADGRILVAGVLARAGLPDSARSVLAQASAMVNSEIDPTQFLISQQAYVRTLLGDYDEAVALLKRYSAANPGHFEDASGGVSWWFRDLQGHPGFKELIGSH